MSILNVNAHNKLYGKFSNNILIVDTMIKYEMIVHKCFKMGASFTKDEYQVTTGFVDEIFGAHPFFSVSVVYCHSYEGFVRSIQKVAAVLPMNLIYYGTCRDTSGWNIALPGKSQKSSFLQHLLKITLEDTTVLMGLKPVETTHEQLNPILNTITSAVCYIDNHGLFPPLRLESEVGVACIKALVRNHFLDLTSSSLKYGFT